MLLAQQIDLILHINTFKNVDLINQGLYNLTIDIEFLETNAHAKPFLALSNTDTAKLNADDNSIRAHNLIDHSIVENKFITKTFLVRFPDEEVTVDDFCLFRVELPKGVRDMQAKVTFSLKFSDFSSTFAKDKTKGYTVNL